MTCCCCYSFKADCLLLRTFCILFCTEYCTSVVKRIAVLLPSRLTRTMPYYVLPLLCAMSPESAHSFSKKVKNLIIVIIQNNIFMLQHRSTTLHFLHESSHRIILLVSHQQQQQDSFISLYAAIYTFLVQ